MFGIGFTELVLISIIAILFLGPDKLPEALVQMAKLIKGIKKTIGEAKDSFEEEIKVADLKKEALTYKKQLDDATAELKSFKNISFDDLDDVSYDDDISEISPMEQVKATQKAKDPYADAPREIVNENPIESKSNTVTFKKKSKVEKEAKTDLRDDT
ncbi:MAG: twin-arginine translocase subunit TatB [Sulfurovum sp.]|nr:MAG: twin-arginine translocase subunit TatB [Sulfurovum sp.]